MKICRKELIGLGLLLAAIVVVRAAEIRPGHEWGCDFAMYLMHAENLTEGRPYADTGYVFNPHYKALGPATYPAGYPLLIAPLYAWEGLDFTAFKLQMLACLVVALALVYFNFRDDLGAAGAGLVVALFGLNHFLHDWVNSLGSDLPFIAWMYAALLAINKAYRVPEGAPPKVGLLVLAGLLAGLCYVTRSLGLLLIPALWGQDLLRNRFRPSLGAVLATAVFAAIVVLQTSFLHSDSAYATLFDFQNLAIVYNTTEYAQRLLLFWDNGYVKALAIPIFLVTLPAVVVGYLMRVLRGASAYELLPLGYLPLVIMFPGYQGARYIVPLLPLYLYYLVGGGQLLLEALGDRTRRRVVAGLAVVIIASYVATYTRLSFAPMTEGISKPTSVALFEHVRSDTPDDAVVVFLKPRAMALLSGRHSTAWHQAATDDEMFDYWKQVGANYVVTAERDEPFVDTERPELIAYGRQFVARHPDRFQPVYANDDLALYKIR